MNKNAFQMLRLGLILLAICACVAAALAGVNAITKDRIAQIKVEKTNKAIGELFPNVTENRQLEAGEYTDATGTVKAVWENADGWAIQVEPSGFNGAIVMMVGVERAGNVVGISVISHTETPSLGAEAASKGAKGVAFRQQFAGLTPDRVSLDAGVDALSGATITSQAVVDGVKAALSCSAVQN